MPGIWPTMSRPGTSRFRGRTWHASPRSTRTRARSASIPISTRATAHRSLSRTSTLPKSNGLFWSPAAGEHWDIARVWRTAFSQTSDVLEDSKWLEATGKARRSLPLGPQLSNRISAVITGRAAWPSQNTQAASTITISLSSTAVTRITSTSLIAAPSRALTCTSSIRIAPIAGTR